jgi:hypothetical protein
MRLEGNLTESEAIEILQKYGYTNDVINEFINQAKCNSKAKVSTIIGGYDVKDEKFGICFKPLKKVIR